jgi:DNA-binding beta-propeller fold protein YncE
VSGPWSKSNLNSPKGLAVDPVSDLLWVTDTGEVPLKVYDIRGRNWVLLGEEGTQPGEFNRPRGIEIDTEREVIWMADTGNDRLQWARLIRHSHS